MSKEVHERKRRRKVFEEIEALRAQVWKLTLEELLALRHEGHRY